MSLSGDFVLKTRRTMVSLRSTALLFAFTISLAASAWGACQTDWFEIEGYCYKDFNEKKTYFQAELHCESIGANLATIPTKGANNVFYSTIRPSNKNRWIGLRGYGDWSNRPLYWEGGVVVDQSQTNWNTNEPNNYGGNEDCAEMIWTSGKWNDIPCTLTRRFVCSTPEGSSTNKIIACPKGWVVHGQYCYYVLQRNLNFDDAYAQCSIDGDGLASIADMDENTFIQHGLDLVSTPYLSLSYWISLKKTRTSWTWYNGIGSYDESTANWAEGEPNNEGGREECGVFNAADGTWSDVPCSWERYAICMKLNTGYRKESDILKQLKQVFSSDVRRKVERVEQLLNALP